MQALGVRSAGISASPDPWRAWNHTETGNGNEVFQSGHPVYEPVQATKILS